MKKLFLAILVILCLSFQASAWNPMVVTSGTTEVATCTTTNIIFWWRAEAADFSATNGTLDYSVGDDTATLNSSAAINTDAVKYGTNGLDLPTSSDCAIFSAITETIDDEGRFGAWVNITTWVAGAAIFDTYKDSDDFLRLLMSGTDELDFAWSDSDTARTTLTSTDANLSTGTWYFIEIAWKTSTNYREIFVNGVSKGSSSATINSFEDVVAFTRFGESQSQASDFFMDNIIVGTVSTDDFYTACKDETEWPE